MDMVTDAVLLFLPLALWPALFVMAPDVVPWTFAPAAYALSPLPALLAALAGRAMRPTGQARALVWVLAAIGLAWGGSMIWLEWDRIAPFLQYQITLSGRITTLMTMISWQYAAGGFALVISAILAFRADRHLGPVDTAQAADAAPALATARFATEPDIRKLWKTPVGLPLGKWPGDILHNPVLLWWNGVGSLLTIAPPGKGKGTSTVGPVLLGYRGPVVCFDPKGENAAVWAGTRANLGHQVAVLNPFDIDIVPTDTAACNPLDFVRNDENFVSDIRVIIDALVIKEPGDKPHFYETSKNVLAGIVAYVCATSEGPMRTLNTVHAILAAGPEVFKAWCAAMGGETAIGCGLVANGANVWLTVGDDERGSHFATINRQVSFLIDPNIRRVLSAPTFDMESLLAGNLDLFVCLPGDRQDDYSRFVRLVVSVAVRTIMRAPRRPRRDVLFLLDELPVLGRMNAILNPETGTGALTVGRAAGIKVWGIVQNPAQLADCYGENGLKVWKSACAVIQVFGVAAGDLAFSEEVSKLLGETTIEVRSTSQGSTNQRHAGQWVTGRAENEGTSVRQMKRWIMSPDEIRGMPSGRQLLLIDDIGRPVQCDRVEYFDWPEWRGRYSRNPLCEAEQPYTRTAKELGLPPKAGDGGQEPREKTD